MEVEHADNELQQIPQIDGAIADLFDFEQPISRTAPYTLNRDKQMEKIQSDATIEDFVVTVNNNDQNVTIKCSSGFYIQVGRATFVTTTQGSTFSKNDVFITLDKITETKDKKGQEATKLLHYSFKTGDEHLGVAWQCIFIILIGQFRFKEAVPCQIRLVQLSGS